MRDLSCYCDFCQDGDYENCRNKAFVKAWDEHILEQEALERRVNRNDVDVIREGLLDVIAKDSIVAIAAADVGEDYYLLKVALDHPEILMSSTKDDWDLRYPAGAKAIRGHFFDRIDFPESHATPFFKLVPEKIAYVYPSAGLFFEWSYAV